MVVNVFPVAGGITDPQSCVGGLYRVGATGYRVHTLYRADVCDTRRVAFVQNVDTRINHVDVSRLQLSLRDVVLKVEPFERFSLGTLFIQSHR